MRRTQAYMNERSAWIQTYISKNGSITIDELVRQFHISPSTARKQLNTMHNNGELVRTHGGAVAATEGNMPKIPYYKEKWAIAELARTLVEDGDLIAIGAGTTTQIFAQALHGVKNLTVITDSIPIANLLRFDPEIEIRLSGGLVRHFNGAVIGRESERFFNNIKVKKAFIGVDSISAGRPVTSRDAYTSYSERAIINSAEKTYVLADHSKVGKYAGIDHLATLDELEGLVTDSGADPKEVEALRKCRIEVLVAGQA